MMCLLSLHIAPLLLPPLTRPARFAWLPCVASVLCCPGSQEKYRSFTRQYFRGAAAAVVLYDIGSAPSFEGAKKWIDDVKSELGSSPKSVALLLVGAKLDCPADERRVTTEQGRALATKEGAVHLECSSKDGTNVTLVFEHVARLLVERGLASVDGGPHAHREQPGIQVTRSRSGQVSAAPGCCQVG